MVTPLSETLTSGPAVALAGLLGRAGDAIDTGWRLPELWHWVYLLDRPAQAELGPDGHRRHGVPAPPRPGLHRLWAGGRVATRHRLTIGAPATRAVEVVGTRSRVGRSGPLTIVTTRATIEQDGRAAVVDEQDIVYRESDRPPAGPGHEPPGAAAVAGPGREVELSEVLLFRFSALTYNAHRIHYDVDYCRDVEHYPGLVVHGPLQALLMAEAAAALAAPATATVFDYRLVAPLFLGQGMRVAAGPDGVAVRTTVRDGRGRLTATGVRRAAA